MTKTILAGLAALLLILPANACAESARPAIEKQAEALHGLEHLEGGSAEVAHCHPGRQRATVVCSVTLRGITQHSGQALEATCSLAVAATWHQIIVEGFRVVGGGYWVAQPASPTLCEGSPIE